jgi:hypothetical protein
VLEAALRAPDFHAAVEAAAGREAALDADRLRLWGDLDDAVNALAFDGGAQLMRRLGPATRWDDGHAEPGDPGEYIVSAVIAAGHARWVHTWSAPLQVEPPQLVPAVAAACRERAAAEPLRQLLAEFGLADDRAPLRLGALTDERLADVLFELSFGPDGRRRLDLTTFPAGLVAAALTELCLHGRVVVGDDNVLAVTGGPIGEEFLDSVLATVSSGRRWTVYQWLLYLGDPVTQAVVARARLRGRYEQRSTFHAENPLVDQGTASAARVRILAALEAGDIDGPDVALGMLLWATELSAPVLGRSARAVLARWQLGRLGNAHGIVWAVRTVLGPGRA